MGNLSNCPENLDKQPLGSVWLLGKGQISVVDSVRLSQLIQLVKDGHGYMGGLVDFVDTFHTVKRIYLFPTRYTIVHRILFYLG